MGAAASVVLRGGDPPPSKCHIREVPYPWTIAQKLRAYPFRHAWRSNIWLRGGVFVGLPVYLLYFWNVDKALNEPMYSAAWWKWFNEDQEKAKHHEQGSIQNRADHLYFSSLGKSINTYNPLEGFKDEFYKWQY